MRKESTGESLVDLIPPHTMPRSMAERLDRTHARGTGTVGKALEVLDAIAEAGRPVRFSELLANSDHPKATLYPQ